MDNASLDAQEVRRQLLETLARLTRAWQDEESVMLQTPLVLTDGHSLRVRLRRLPDGLVEYTDGGYTAGELYIFARPEEEERLKRLARAIAWQHHLEWDEGLKGRASTLEEAIAGLWRMCVAASLILGEAYICGKR